MKTIKNILIAAIVLLIQPAMAIEDFTNPTESLETQTIETAPLHMEAVSNLRGTIAKFDFKIQMKTEGKGYERPTIAILPLHGEIEKDAEFKYVAYASYPVKDLKNSIFYYVTLQYQIVHKSGIGNFYGVKMYAVTDKGEVSLVSNH